MKIVNQLCFGLAIAFLMSSCYLFCLFKSDDMMEDVVEQFIENTLKEEDHQ